MKRFLVFTAAAALGLGCVSAQKFTTQGDIFRIPGEYVNDGVSRIGYTDSNGNGEFTIGIYDEDFKVTSSVNFSIPMERYAAEVVRVFDYDGRWFCACQGVFVRVRAYLKIAMNIHILNKTL